MTTLVGLFPTFSGPLFCEVSDMIFHSSWVSFCYSSLPVRRNYGLLRLTIQSPESTVATSKQLPADGGKFVEEVFEFAGNVEKGARTVNPWWREDHRLPQSKRFS
jgi:hypothetical protein